MVLSVEECARVWRVLRAWVELSPVLSADGPPVSAGLTAVHRLMSALEQGQAPCRLTVELLPRPAMIAARVVLQYLARGSRGNFSAWLWTNEQLLEVEPEWLAAWNHLVVTDYQQAPAAAVWEEPRRRRMAPEEPRAVRRRSRRA